MSNDRYENIQGEHLLLLNLSYIAADSENWGFGDFFVQKWIHLWEFLPFFRDSETFQDRQNQHKIIGRSDSHYLLKLFPILCRFNFWFNNVFVVFIGQTGFFSSTFSQSSVVLHSTWFKMCIKLKTSIHFPHKKKKINEADGPRVDYSIYRLCAAFYWTYVTKGQSKYFSVSQFLLGSAWASFDWRFCEYCNDFNTDTWRSSGETLKDESWSLTFVLDFIFDLTFCRLFSFFLLRAFFPLKADGTYLALRWLSRVH